MCASDLVDLAIDRIVAGPGKTQLLLFLLLVVVDIVNPAALKLKIHHIKHTYSAKCIIFLRFTVNPDTNIPLQPVPDVRRIGDGTWRGNELPEAGFDGQLGGCQELLFRCDRPATDEKLDHN